MKLNKRKNMKNKDAITQLVNSGYDVDFKRLSICNIGNYVQMRGSMPRRFQVEIQSSQISFSEVYADLDVAVDKFIALRNLLCSKKSKNENRN